MTQVVSDRTYFPEDGNDEASRFDAKFQEIVSELSTSELRTSRPKLSLGDLESDLPEQFVEILVQVAAAMKQGKAITVMPRNTVLTTQEAADMLAISRPTLVKLLETGKIPFMKVNRHRRVYLTDVVEYQKRQRDAASQALDDMVADSEMFNDYDASPEEIRDALKEVRDKA